MFGISFAELMIVFLLVLVVMGPEKLPEVARWAGKGLRELRKASNTLRGALEMEEIKDASSTPTTKPRPRQLPHHASEDTSKKSPPADDAGGPSSPASEAAADPLPSGLDQVDDAQFEKLLQEQYALRHGGRQRHRLAPRRPADQRHTHAMEGRRTTTARDDIPLSARQEAHS